MLDVEIGGRYRPGARYPHAIVNVTNRCNLACAHCFVFRAGNPNQAPRCAGDRGRAAAPLVDPAPVVAGRAAEPHPSGPNRPESFGYS